MKAMKRANDDDDEEKDKLPKTEAEAYAAADKLLKKMNNVHTAGQTKAEELKKKGAKASMTEKEAKKILEAKLGALSTQIPHVRDIAVRQAFVFLCEAFFGKHWNLYET